MNPQNSDTMQSVSATGAALAPSKRFATPEVCWNEYMALYSEDNNGRARGRAQVQKLIDGFPLYNQKDFVKDGKMTVRQYLQSINKELTVTSFKRVSLNG
jgi:hypothetical protein